MFQHLVLSHNRNCRNVCGATFLVTTTITGRICSGYLNYFYYSWLKLKNHGFEAFFMNKILLKYQSQICKTREIIIKEQKKKKKNSFFHHKKKIFSFQLAFIYPEIITLIQVKRKPFVLTSRVLLRHRL